MNVQKAREVAQWLINIGGNPASRFRYIDVQAVEVTIGKQTFYGARYLCAEYGTDGVEITNSTRYYLLGDMPQCYKRSQRVCFTMANNPHELYVSGFYNEEYLKKNKYVLNPNAQEFHPFGDCFMMAEWTAPTAIDVGERWTYKRIAMTTQRFGLRKAN